jgi:hypothetical protein
VTIPNADPCSKDNEGSRATANVDNNTSNQPSGYLEEDDLYYDSSDTADEPIAVHDAEATNASNKDHEQHSTHHSATSQAPDMAPPMPSSMTKHPIRSTLIK